MLMLQTNTRVKMKKVIWTGAVFSLLALAVYLLQGRFDATTGTGVNSKPERTAQVASQKTVVDSQGSATINVAIPPVRSGNVPSAPEKSAARRVRNGDRLAELHAELTTGNHASPASEYIARKIVEQCQLVAIYDESNFVPRNESTRALAVSSLRKLKQSCAGIGISPLLQKRMAEQKELALANAVPSAVADEAMMMSAQGLPGDAFEIYRGLLKVSPSDPDVWQRAIEMLPAFGIQIGSGDEQLRNFSPGQMRAATALAACEATLSCALNDSSLLQIECVSGGHCASSTMEYFREFGLTPAEMSGIAVATARLSDLISQGRWDLIGYAPANRPAQTKATTLPPPPSK